MKKYLYLLMVALFATMPFALTSCGDDNDEPDNPSSDIVGSWKCTDEIYEALGATQYIRFDADGTYYEIDIYNGETEVSEGHWSKKGNTINIGGGDFHSITAEIKKLNKSDLTLNVLSIDLHYKKVSNSVTDKYL